MNPLTPADVLMLRDAHIAIAPDEQRDVVAGLQDSLLTVEADRMRLKAELAHAERAMRELQQRNDLQANRLMWLMVMLWLALVVGVVGWVR